MYAGLWSIAIAGLLLMSAPFAFSYHDNPIALWSNLIVGATVVTVSVYQGQQHTAGQWAYWVAGAAGLLAVSLPFALGFHSNTAALLSSVMIGSVVAVLAEHQLLAPTART